MDILSGEAYDIYIDPSLLDSLKEKNINPQYNAFKADVFSLGISVNILIRF